jgi:hypothetical protein
VDRELKLTNAVSDERPDDARRCSQQRDSAEHAGRFCSIRWEQSSLPSVLWRWCSFTSWLPNHLTALLVRTLGSSFIGCIQMLVVNTYSNPSATANVVSTWFPRVLKYALPSET